MLVVGLNTGNGNRAENTRSHGKARNVYKEARVQACLRAEGRSRDTFFEPTAKVFPSRARGGARAMMHAAITLTVEQRLHSGRPWPPGVGGPW